jgi:MFS family permease
MQERSSGQQARVAFEYPNFRFYIAARFLTILALEMQAVAVGWQVYALTNRPLDLGLVGLAQFLPGIFLFLAAGHAADRHSRQGIVRICCIAFSVCSVMLLGLTAHGLRSAYPVYLVLLLNGAVRAFNGPAIQAFLPSLVPAEHFHNAVTWNASLIQSAMILGPVAGGLLYGLTGSPVSVYVCAAVAGMLSYLSISAVQHPKAGRPPADTSLNQVLDGLRYIWRNKLVLGTISLDLFAVLLGGAVALLPIYARDILHVGATGLGVLRSAPGVGAVLMAIVVAHWPLRRRAGTKMLLCVFGFGVFTVVFALSRNMVLSLAALVLTGALDMVSVVVRQTLVQLATPEEMRGRVSAVNTVFIGASNEVGQFESGLTAQWFGAVPAAVIGGIGTIVVVALWARWFPAMRKIDDLSASASHD